MYEFVSVYKYVLDLRCPQKIEIFDFPGTVVTSSCMPHNVGTGVKLGSFARAVLTLNN